MPNDMTLWNRLQAMELDQADAAFRFSDRLARENGWSKDFARGAIAEYKRFIYLAVTSPTQVTPSDIVDRVWHLHLTFTRSYWDEMCTQVLGRPLHHGPTKGGQAEDRRYRNQYSETLALYRKTFGEEPPAAYWPAAQERFASGLHQQWVDRRTHFVLPRAGVVRSVVAAIATTGLAALAGSATAAEPSVGGDLEAYALPGGIALAVIVMALIVLGSLGGKRRHAGKAGTSSSSSSGYVFGCTATSSSSKGGKDGNGGEGGETGGESGGESGGDGGGGCGGGGCGGGGD